MNRTKTIRLFARLPVGPAIESAGSSGQLAVRIVWPVFIACCLLLACLSRPAQAIGLDLDVADIVHTHFAVRNIKLHLASASQQAQLEIGEITLADWTFSQVKFVCSQFVQQGNLYSCQHGTIRLGPDVPEWPVMFRYDGKTLDATIDPNENGRWHLTWTAERGLTLDVNDADLALLIKRIPLPAGTHLAGRVSAHLNWLGGLEGRIQVKEGGFADAAGNHAGEKLSFAIDFSAKPETPGTGTPVTLTQAAQSIQQTQNRTIAAQGNRSRPAGKAVPAAPSSPPTPIPIAASANETAATPTTPATTAGSSPRPVDPTRIVWNWKAKLDWQGGEIFWLPFYFPHAQFALDAEGRVSTGGKDGRDRFRITRANLDIHDVGEIEFRGIVAHGAEGIELRQAVLSTDRLDLKNAGKIFVAPWLAQGGKPALDFSGIAGVKLDFTRGQLNSLTVVLAEAGIAEPRGRFGLEKVTGLFNLKPGERVEHNVYVGGANLGRLKFGAFNLPFFLSADKLEVPSAVIPILDSELHIDNLIADNHSGAWRWQMAAWMTPISLPLLSEVLEFPRMEGSMAASIPLVKQEGVEISFDGGLNLQVFDGQITANHLKVIDLMGHLPRVTTDLDVQRIDLGRLTKTFSFGRIEGFIDASIDNLEIAQWKPIQFIAKIVSSQGDYRKRISQRAVENITALGGPGAAAAIQRSVLRVFNDFGYKRLGLSCTLNNGVCQMGGVGNEKSGAYTIIEGGGIPSLSVMGYNHRVDWDELLMRLHRVIENNTAPTIQ